DTVSHRDVLDAGAHLFDGADRLVAEDAAFGHRGHVALEDVQVRAADGRGVDPHDGVGVGGDARSRDLLPVFGTGTVVDDCTHGSSSWRHPAVPPRTLGR